METQRLKAKIGEHEFDAEGPVEIVQAQFQAWKELIASTSAKHNVSTQPHENQGKTEGETNKLNKIIRLDGRVVSLTIKPTSETDAALLVLYGQRMFRENESVTASELRDGLQHSGYRFARVDRLMQPLCDEGMVVRIGAKKATRYRLINPGMARATELAQQALATVS